MTEKTKLKEQLKGAVKFLTTHNILCIDEAEQCMKTIAQIGKPPITAKEGQKLWIKIFKETENK